MATMGAPPMTGLFDRKLKTAPAVNDLSILVNKGVPTNLGGRTHIVIDPWTNQCEFRKINTASGRTLTFDGGLNFAHHVNDDVLITYAPEAHSVWWGVKGDDNNWGAELNAALTQINDSEAFHASELWLPKGLIGTTVPIDIPHEITVDGHGQLYTGSLIRAKSGFSFPNGNTAIIRQIQGGLTIPVTYTTAVTEMGRIRLRNVGIDGNNIAGANGILCSMQQPATWHDVRVHDCLGLYGLCAHDGQHFKVDGLTFNNCKLPIENRGQSFFWINDLNIERTKDADTSSTSRDVWCRTSVDGSLPLGMRVTDAHFETNGWQVFDVDDGDVLLDNPYITGRADQSSGQRQTLLHVDRTHGTDSNHIPWEVRSAQSGGTRTYLDLVHDVNGPGTIPYRIPAEFAQAGQPSAIVEGPPYNYLVRAAFDDLMTGAYAQRFDTA